MRVFPPQQARSEIRVLAACKTLGIPSKQQKSKHTAQGSPKRISDGTGVRGRFIEAAGALLTPKDGLLHRREEHCL